MASSRLPGTSHHGMVHPVTGSGTYVMIDNIDPSSVSASDIQQITQIPIISYQPRKTENKAILLLANSMDATVTVQKLNGRRFLGKVIHADLVTVSQLPASSGTSGSIHGQSTDQMCYRDPLASPLAMSGSGRPPNTQYQRRPAQSHSPHRPTLVQAPRAKSLNRMPQDSRYASSPGFGKQPSVYPDQIPRNQSPARKVVDHRHHQPNYPPSFSQPPYIHPHQSSTSPYQRHYSVPIALACSQGPQHQAGSTVAPKSTYAVKVTHLSPSVTPEMLHVHFHQAGELAQPGVKIHDSTSRYAHVNFTNGLAAQTAVSKLDGTILGGWKINVKASSIPATSSFGPVTLPDASVSCFLPGEDAESDMKTLKVSNLPPGVQEMQLFDHFGQYGSLTIDTSSSRILSKDTEAPFAYVNYFSSEDARKAASSVPQQVTFSGVSRQLKIRIQKSKVHARERTLSVDQLSRHTQQSNFVQRANQEGLVRDESANVTQTPVQGAGLVMHPIPQARYDRPSSTLNFGELPPELGLSALNHTSRVKQESVDSTSSSDGDVPDTDDQSAAPKDKTRNRKKGDGKPIVVAFTVKGHTGRSNFKHYLERNLEPGVAFEVSRVSIRQVEVQFARIAEALSSLQKLKECDVSLEAAFLNPKLDLVELEKSVSSFTGSIETKKSCYLTEHKEVVAELKQQLQNLVLPKKCTLDMHKKIEGQRNILTQAIKEREYQQREFEMYCERLQENLNLPSLCTEALKDGQNGIVKRLRRNFGAECNRFKKALPIYAYRSEIVKSVQDNQVCVLIGETGSGKSTQLVQYLYDAGFTNGGIIVCTQPRKVAAISLAKHVCTEMGETRVGDVLGYKTGIRGKFCDQTKVLYMTDHTLLNECISDPTFAKYSCLVIDEAHERSLSTDILLAFIKRSLDRRPDLRVIITSATIDPDLFVRYFNGACPTIRVPGRTFPVDVIWNPLDLAEPPLERPYASDAVLLVCNLCASEPPGDILVFLTSPADIEKACQEATNKLGDDALILPLHGKLQPDEQQKVFSEDHEQRKIIFATNVAETSVTIPGVKYVVDTGLAKELCFDPKRNMNSLEVRTISKSSAEQRKGRAGRTSAGKCYRLYSEEVYEKMPDKMLPEILRVALATAVLKLYEFGISDILSFQFVEPPDPTALQAAIESLLFLGAVKDDKLTDLGRRMASLPMDPHLAKILFDGIEAGVGAEAVASVAISMLAGSVFFRAGTDEMKQESDMKRITFLHAAGDQMTCLQTYHQWSSQSKDRQNQWCVDSFVNAKSMRMIRECVKEILDVLGSKFQIVVPRSFDSLQQAEEKLPKLYFHTFIKNLCVYLGHERVGYLNARLPDEQLIIFPGSSLRQMNSVPLFLIYEKTLRTSQHFMLHLLPVNEEWIREAVATKKLACNPFESATFQHLCVSPLSIENLSEHIMRLTLKEDQSIINELGTVEIQPVFDRSLRKIGKITVFLQTFHHNALSSLLHGRIRSIREELKKEILERGLTKEEDDVRVIMANGGRVLRLLMPHEYRTVVVKGPKGGEWCAEVYENLQTCGTIQTYKVHDKLRSEDRLFVTFESPESAVLAVTSLELPENVNMEPQMFRKQGGAPISSFKFTLIIEWSRRDRQNFGFVNFQHEEDQAIALTQLCGGHGVSIGGSLIKLKPSRKEDRQLFMTNIGLHLTTEDVKQQLQSYLPGVQQGDYDVTLGREKSFKTTPEQHAALKEELEGLILPSTTRGNYSVELLFPKDQHHVYRAFVKFKNPEEGQQALQSLVHNTIGGKQLSVKPNLSSVVRYSPQVYKVVKESIESAAREIQDRFRGTVSIKHNKVDKGGNVLITVTSSDVSSFVVAKHALNTVINPEVIECCTPELREFIQTANCRTSLDKIGKVTDTLIRIDYRLSNIRMYGTQANLTQAKIQFNEILSVFADGTKSYEFHLKKQGMPPGIMKQLVAKFGHGLHGLEELNGVKTARLNPQRQILSIFGTSDAYQSVVELLQGLAQAASYSRCAVEIKPDEVECCVCFTTTANPSDIIRLESCGHAYCIECITLQISPSTLIAVPVSCAGDECSKPFVVKDFETLLRRTDFKLQNLIQVSLRSYVAANQKVVHVCPTPDCDMVYNITEDGRCFLCSHCGVMTCTKCHEPYHDGLSCEMYQAGKNGDKEFDEWMKHDPSNRKRCPKCSTPIEKTYGCNHMHCTQCSAHICWFCLEYFNTSDGL